MQASLVRQRSSADDRRQEPGTVGVPKIPKDKQWLEARNQLKRNRETLVLVEEAIRNVRQAMREDEIFFWDRGRESS